jgi:glycosyltransferase involved in cell wall biosynthesis
LNGVDPTHFVARDPDQPSEHNGRKRLLFVGRVSPEKGVHVLLQAMEKVTAQYPNVELNVVGPPGAAPYEYMVLISDDPKVNALKKFYSGRFYKDHYQEHLQYIANGMPDHIHFTGSVPHAQTVDHYAQADVLINPSLTEAFGMSLVEAMCSRVPVVATRVGGMPAVVDDGTTGLLVEPDQPEALADAILCLLRDDSLRTAMGTAGYQRVHERYTWDLIAESLWDQYVQLCDRDSARQHA